MGIIDAVSDFMRGSRKRTHAKLSRTKAGGFKCHCHAYKFPHKPGGGKCRSRDHAEGAARYFGKKPRGKKGAHKRKSGPYFKKPGISSPFHACVSKKMNAGMSLRAASKSCAAARKKARKSKGRADGA